ncbi:hypothetical protein P7K49_013297, partial [Saguinus oedipus]
EQRALSKATRRGTSRLWPETRQCWAQGAASAVLVFISLGANSVLVFIGLGANSVLVFIGLGANSVLVFIGLGAKKGGSMRTSQPPRLHPGEFHVTIHGIHGMKRDLRSQHPAPLQS